MSNLNKYINNVILENVEYEGEIGDDVIITGDVNFKGATGVISDFGRDRRFVIVDLYNHGKHSFHASDVSLNEYADSDEEAEDLRDPGLTESGPHDIDQLISELTARYRTIASSDAYTQDGKQQIRRVYEMLRTPLMKGDVEGFREAWRNASASFPDAFDELLDTGVDLKNALGEAMSTTSLGATVFSGEKTGKLTANMEVTSRNKTVRLKKGTMVHVKRNTLNDDQDKYSIFTPEGKLLGDKIISSNVNLFKWIDDSGQRGLGEDNKQYTGRETKDGVWRVFEKDNPVAVAGPFDSSEEANEWIKDKADTVTTQVTESIESLKKLSGLL